MEQTSQDITPAPSVIIPSTQVLSASLLGLPGELRERILVEVVRRHDTINLSSLRPPPIALVNRQLFRETAAALCEANTFAVDVDLAYRILVTRPQDAVGDSPRPRLRVFSAATPATPAHHAKQLWSTYSGRAITTTATSTYSSSTTTLSDSPPDQALLASGSTTTWMEYPERRRPAYDRMSFIESRPWLRVAGTAVIFRNIVFYVRTGPGLERRLEINLDLRARNYTTSLSIEYRHPGAGITIDRSNQRTALRHAQAQIGEYTKAAFQRPGFAGFSLFDIGAMADLFNVGEITPPRVDDDDGDL